MQTILVILIFAGAAGYLGWRAYQSLSLKKAGCGKGCGCENAVPTVDVVPTILSAGHQANTPTNNSYA